MIDDLLESDDFAAFFYDVHEVTPFDWQRDLVVAVAESGVWPELIDLPTGSGKTALLDIAVFLLAMDAQRSPADRHAPRRIVMVVDRRVVVDQAADRANRIRRGLEHPAGPITDAVAGRLRSLSGSRTPLRATVLRGGIVQDSSWALRPDVPAVIASTVDQVGSRLLFRGYGVSEGLRPVHAGLLGTDTLILLDEVHLSQPFAQTLRAIGGYQAWAEEVPTNARWQVVELSATPGNSVTRQFPPGPLDAGSSKVLRRRLEASKPADLRAVTVSSTDQDKARMQLATAAQHAAADLLALPHMRVIAVVVNRVDTARATHQLLANSGVEAVLITGRMRPFDRDELVQGLLPRVQMGRVRSEDDRPLVLVATQCIEAGADFDVDGVVTECASLDALRQRFGRLDRDGQLADRGTPGRGIVLGLSASVLPGSNDAVYGEALAKTWSWLSHLPLVDFGIRSLQLPHDDELLPLLARRPDAPVLFPAHLDAWVQTRPAPYPDPDLGRWLHGLADTSVDVNVVWRADLTETFLRDHGAQAMTLVASCPPASGEAMSVPLAAACRWLAGLPQPAGFIADVDGAPDDVSEEHSHRGEGGEGRPALRWKGEHSSVGFARDIRPGDTIVVPAGYGGLRDGTWDPASIMPVTDLGHQAQRQQRRRAVLRLVPPLWPERSVPSATASEEDSVSTIDVLTWLRQAVHDGLDPEEAQHAELLLRTGSGPSVRQIVGPSFTDGDATAAWFVLTCRRPFPSDEESLSDTAVDMEEETSSFTSTEVTLLEHLHGVERWARLLATNCGLPDWLVADVALAARLHDLGKVDPRFQVMLHGGDEVESLQAEEPLAKSATPALDAPARRAARERSGYPSTMRHEVVSLAMIEGHADIERAAHDWDLVRHLVASHHGWCRPFAPVVEDPAPQRVAFDDDLGLFVASSDPGLDRLDGGIAERFWCLVRRYGWFRLAWFEAILRLADHRRSEQEQRELENSVGR